MNKINKDNSKSIILNLKHEVRFLKLLLSVTIAELAEHLKTIDKLKGKGEDNV